MSAENYNVINFNIADRNSRMLNFKLKTINNKINEQKTHIEQLKEAIASKETDNILLEKRLNSIQKLHGNKIKEIEEQTQKMEQIQKSVWNERNALETKIQELETKQKQVKLQADSNLKESIKLNGTKNGLKNYLSKTDEEILKLRTKVEDVQNDSFMKKKK